MQDQDHLSRLRAERKRLRIIGAVLCFLAYHAYIGMFMAFGEAANLFLMLLIMIAFLTGIILLMRSFFHIKFMPLHKEKTKR